MRILNFAILALFGSYGRFTGILPVYINKFLQKMFKIVLEDKFLRNKTKNYKKIMASEEIFSPFSL